MMQVESLRRLLRNQSRFCNAVHINVESLICHFNEFNEVIRDVNLDIIALTETHLKAYIDDNAVSVVNYNLIRNDRRYTRGVE